MLSEIVDRLSSASAGSARFVRLLLLASVVLAGSGCQSPVSLSGAHARTAGVAGVAGQTLIYRFPSGRTYQAEYGCDQIHFVLLKPELAPPPSKTMPFTARSIRPGIDLVVWEDPEFHTTFVVDLERRILHASALRGGTSPFLGQAEIVETRPTRDAAGEPFECSLR